MVIFPLIYNSTFSTRLCNTTILAEASIYCLICTLMCDELHLSTDCFIKLSYEMQLNYLKPINLTIVVSFIATNGTVIIGVLYIRG